MKNVQLFMAALLAVAVMIGCGGSGGQKASTGVTAISSTPRVEAVVLNPTSFDGGVDANGNHYSFVLQDPTNIESQDQVQFQLVNYTVSGTTVTRNVLPTTLWETSDTSSTYGVLGPDSGVFIAKTNQTNNNIVVSTFYNGRGYATVYKVLPRQVRLRGQILSDDTHAPVSGVVIQFFGLQDTSDPSSPMVLQGQVTTAYDGTFRASIPETATAFQLVDNSLPDTYQRFFRFEGSLYQTGNDGCRAPLPLNTNGERFLIDYTNPDVTANGTILLLSKNETAVTASDVSCVLR